jgi:hypothetical protein
MTTWSRHSCRIAPISRSGQVVATNPAHAVRGPKHIVRRGKTSVLTGDQAPGRFISVKSTFMSKRALNAGKTQLWDGCRPDSQPGCPTISASTSSRDVDEIRKSSNPGAPGDATLSVCMSSTWFRVMGGWGSSSAT